ncbi:Phr family secreted Rap phosphatase inhibitor [Bacillus cereus group sp. BfR-BA-01380]|uniref:Phr family secreted Rap phosphatase inhibitor n=1 Tax=Bacillus cereus group sp. BfR-BA-01380 TaxID=2920324 RepID=UPI001F5AF619|nr:Phr family secreted Rap phosphatase inhibitor [Bacillus cereus group sp. BfR-BA-01380]
MKKLRVIALGLSCVGILSFGINNDSPQSYAYGDYPVPQRPDLAYNIGDTGGIVSNEAVGDPGTDSPSYSHADFPAPQKSGLAYTHGDPGVGGGSVSTEGEANLPTLQA